MQIEDSVIAHFLFGCHVGNLASVRRNLDPAELSHTKDESGNTGLVLAAEVGHLEIVKFLLTVDESSDHLNALNKYGRSALMVAVDGDKIDVVKEILKHEDVDKAIKDRWGMTAVDIGCVRGQAEIVELLGGKIKEREIPVKMRGRSKTVKHCNTKISSLAAFSSPSMGKAPTSLGARPKMIQSKNRKHSRSVESLFITTKLSNVVNLGEVKSLASMKTEPEAGNISVPIQQGSDQTHSEALESGSNADTGTDTGSFQISEIEQQNGVHEISIEKNENDVNFENLFDVFDLDPIFLEDENNDIGGELSTANINNDLIEEVRKNILAKIDEYNGKISEEESSFMAMKDLLLKNKKVQTVLMTEINKEKKEFYEKIRKEKEIFEKKQESEMNLFWEHIRSRQETLQRNFAAEESRIEKKEKRVENFRNIVQMLVTRLSSITELNLLEKQKSTRRRSMNLNISDLECPVCLEKMVPPKRIFQCRQGHAICGNCFERPQVKKCPTCRGIFIGRATVLEKVAAALLAQNRL